MTLIINVINYIGDVDIVCFLNKVIGDYLFIFLCKQFYVYLSVVMMFFELGELKSYVGNIDTKEFFNVVQEKVEEVKDENGEVKYQGSGGVYIALFLLQPLVVFTFSTVLGQIFIFIIKSIVGI